MGKLKASTLVEVIVALVIISTIITIALMTFLNLMRSGDLKRRTEAALHADQLAQVAKHNQQYINETVTHDHIVYQLSFTPYDRSNRLLLMEITALDQKEKVVYNLKEVIIDE